MKNSVFNMWNIESKISLAILSWVTSETELSREDFLKCKLGIETIVINIFKLFLIYFIAFKIRSITNVFFTHIGFLSIRLFGYGKHSINSLLCVLTSLFLLLLIPHFYLSYFLLSDNVLNILFIPLLLLTGNFAPGNSRKNSVRKQKRKNILTFLTLINTSIVFFIGLLVNSLVVRNLFFLGSFIGLCCLIGPVERRKE